MTALHGMHFMMESALVVYKQRDSETDKKSQSKAEKRKRDEHLFHRSTVLKILSIDASQPIVQSQSQHHVVPISHRLHDGDDAIVGTSVHLHGSVLCRAWLSLA